MQQLVRHQTHHFVRLPVNGLPHRAVRAISKLLHHLVSVLYMGAGIYRVRRYGPLHTRADLCARTYRHASISEGFVFYVPVHPSPALLLLPLCLTSRCCMRHACAGLSKLGQQWLLSPHKWPPKQLRNLLDLQRGLRGNARGYHFD